MFYKTKKKTQIVAAFFCLFIFFIVTIPSARLETVDEMSKRIEQKKDEIDNLLGKVKTYQNKINEAKKQTVTLKRELTIVNDEIKKNELDIDITEKQIMQTNLEIQKIILTIDQKEKEIEKLKKQLSEFIRILYENDQVSYLSVLMMNDTFSDFFDQYEYLQNIQDKIQLTIKDIKIVKSDLEIQKIELNDKRKREVALKQTLEIEKSELLAVSNEKETLLSETKNSEKRFQNYVEELKAGQKSLNGEIVALEKKVRDELERIKKEERFNDLGPVRLQWPVTSREITSYFHDPEYPYRYIFEHPAVDIRTSQGTPIKAAEAGYVAKTKDGGAKGYSYIMLLHSEGVSTVYGHVSSISVKEKQYVNKNDIIGYSGGRPGTPGAGPLTTGPHLHFEVRKNGIPVNPTNYLP